MLYIWLAKIRLLRIWFAPRLILLQKPTKKRKLPSLEIECFLINNNEFSNKNQKKCRAFATEIRDDDSTFGVFAPQNKREDLLMSGAIEAKLLEDMKSKHSAPKMFVLAQSKSNSSLTHPPFKN